MKNVNLLLTRVEIVENRDCNGYLVRDDNGLSSSRIEEIGTIIVNFDHVLYVTPHEFYDSNRKKLTVSHIVFATSGELDVKESISHINKMLE